MTDYLDTTAPAGPSADEKSSEGTANLSRRHFLGVTGALIVGINASLTPREALAAASGGQIGAYIRIAADETVTVLIGSSEMGQGIMTGLAQLVAEELRVPWKNIRVRHAPASADYANPMFHFQLTGGSTTLRGWYTPLRKAAAAAREMLEKAGAKKLGVSVSDVEAVNGQIIAKGGDRVSYGDVAHAASLLTPNSDPALTPDSELKVIGKSKPRVDLPAKVDGSAIYGIDVRLPGMVYAAVKHAPRLGGKLKSTPNKPAGALAVVPLGNAVAVVSTNTWNAMRLARNLSASWVSPKDLSAVDSTAISAKAVKLMATGKSVVAEKKGNVISGIAAGAHKINATYELPYLAHACMEPLNATAHVTKDLCEIWAPTQGQGSAVFTAMAATGLPAEKIRVHTTFLGGGLGRKFEQDFIRQAVLVAKAVGKPVKLTWSRGEDFANDQYRPMALVNIKAGVNKDGSVTGFKVRSVSPSITWQRNPAMTGADSSAVEGSVDLPYAFDTRGTSWVRHTAAIPVGYWRSVGHSINAFAVESAMDELADAAGIDPLAFRLKLLGDDARARAVLHKAADLADWSSTVPKGRARGIAYHESFGSRVAEVVEISIPAAGSIKVHRVAVAIDCGRVVNPDQIEAQMQSAVVHGLSSALWGQMTFNKGAARQRNFGSYKSVRMRDMPVVKVGIIAGGDPIGGVGEPGVPPLAPALANAYARLTGKRIRALPFFAGASGGGDDDDDD